MNGKDMDSNLDCLTDINESDRTSEEIYEWHYFVHYLGWNVKWDAWIPEYAIYEHCPESVQFAKQIKNEIKAGGKNIHERTARLELQYRLKEFERKSMKKGNDNDNEDNVDTDIDKEESNKQKYLATLSNKGKKKLSKASLKRLQRQDLEEIDLSLADELPLPLSMKGVLVMEWEVISQAKNVPNLPAIISIKTVLGKYLDQKLQLLDESHKAKEEKEKKANVIEAETPDINPNKFKKEMKRQEYFNMVEGILMYFDDLLSNRLLFRQELGQYESMIKYIKEKDLHHIRMCEIYGCEHLLRLFSKLPEFLREADKRFDIDHQTSTEDIKAREKEMRKKYAMIGDLIRYLAKHERDFFKMTYRKPRDDELREVEIKESESETTESSSEDEPQIEANEANNYNQVQTPAPAPASTSMKAKGTKYKRTRGEKLNASVDRNCSSGVKSAPSRQSGSRKRRTAPARKTKHKDNQKKESLSSLRQSEVVSSSDSEEDRYFRSTDKPVRRGRSRKRKKLLSSLSRKK